MLAILDSGVGGLGVLRHVRRTFPQADILYFADQARAPLGERSAGELRALFQSYVSFVESRGAAAIAMGSNTLCAIARTHGWPLSTIPIVDLIAPAAAAAAGTGARRIGVLATKATVRSHVFAQAIGEIATHASVQEVDAPELVSLVENGHFEGIATEAAIRRACERFELPLDALVLGCTHYQWLEPALRAEFGEAMCMIDPAESVVAVMAGLIGPDKLEKGDGRTQYVTTGRADAFRAGIMRLTGTLDACDSVASIDPADGVPCAK